MPLDRHAARLIALIACNAAPRPGQPTIEEIRAGADALAAFAAPAPSVERVDDLLSFSGRETPIRRYAPVDAGDGLTPGIVYFHGGGLVSGSLKTHDSICADLAAGAGCRVIAIDYRLAPEHRFPAAWEDARGSACAIAESASAFGLDSARIGVAGDSAGAALAVAAARALNEAGRPARLQLLLCPVLASLAATPSRRKLAKGHLIDAETLAAFWDLYRVPNLKVEDPRVSPLYDDDLAGLPPALIHSAEFDPLADEAELYAEALRDAGVAVKLTRHPGLIHHFYALGGAIPAARIALATIAAELRTEFAAA